VWELTHCLRDAFKLLLNKLGLLGNLLLVTAYGGMVLSLLVLKFLTLLLTHPIIFIVVVVSFLGWFETL